MGARRVRAGSRLGLVPLCDPAAESGEEGFGIGVAVLAGAYPVCGTTGTEKISWELFKAYLLYFNEIIRPTEGGRRSVSSSR